VTGEFHAAPGTGHGQPEIEGLGLADEGRAGDDLGVRIAADMRAV
jgi:hypothetical protein